LIFFNLNVIHNYYQLPLLAPLALLIAYALQEGFAKHRSYAFAALLCLLIGNTAYAEWKYYEVPHHLVEIGQVIRQYTTMEDLLVVTYQNFDCRNPRILYRARRRGWSIEELALNDRVLQNLIGEGAQVWAYIGKAFPETVETHRFSPPKIIPLENGDDQLFLFSLQKEEN
ncbi:MAG: hypothetical protein AAF985_05875, partial [Bacteroidota bacterium]